MCRRRRGGPGLRHAAGHRRPLAAPAPGQRAPTAGSRRTTCRRATATPRRRAAGARRRPTAGGCARRAARSASTRPALPPRPVGRPRHPTTWENRGTEPRSVRRRPCPDGHASAATARRAARTTASGRTPDTTGRHSGHGKRPATRRPGGAATAERVRRRVVAVGAARPRSHLAPVRDASCQDDGRIGSRSVGRRAPRPPLRGQQLLELLVQAVLGQARPALVQVALQQRTPLPSHSWSRKSHTSASTSAQSVSCGLPQLMRGPGARRGLTVTALPRRKPRSRAVSVRMSRSWRRPRCSRDITVPIGVPMISAISL